MSYSTPEVAKILGLSEAQVRSYVRSGFLEPERLAGGRLQFSFSDLVFLRAAKGLASAGLPPRRIRRALGRLREQLPPGRRLTGLRIMAQGDEVVAEDGEATWQADTGQTLLDFGVSEIAKKAAPLARRQFREANREADEMTAEDWFVLGCELDTSAPEEARQAYARAIDLAPGHADAHVNLGRLLHESGDPAGAEPRYRRALALDPQNPTAAFNLAVALEDLGRTREALEAYRQAVTLDPGSGDAHYNAAHLCIRLGETAEALRHLQQYRKLSRH